eukprot:TRINITY_DN26334_c0_g1_i2.p1 TRINITY_DN26334_c0_g1~~TRINITY_DN26334_c0_g1_i2.p1  ORF type:complete len:432 (-),score=91.45 TRINITY_DN26334_c0_g1_i2:326-1450(-)
MLRSLVGSEMCIRDRVSTQSTGGVRIAWMEEWQYPDWEGESPRKPTQLWKTNDAKAQKEGGRKTIYSSVKAMGRPKDQYTGEWHGNKKEGMGTQIFKNQDRYVGTWANGKRDGQGEYYKMVNGQLFKSYSGEWKDGARHGRGMLFGKDGELYDGAWVNGRRHGEGKQTYANGDVYEGRWCDHQRHGWGRVTMNSGDIFEGHFLEDKKEGSGTYYYMSKQKRMDGEWVADSCTCGVLSHFELDANADPSTCPPRYGQDTSKRLPQLGLKDAHGLLQGCLVRVKQERGAVRLLKTPVEEIFVPEDLDQLVACFNTIAEHDRRSGGYITVQSVQDAVDQLGIEVSQEHVDSAVGALGVKDGVDMESFCRIIALCVSE